MKNAHGSTNMLVSHEQRGVSKLAHFKLNYIYIERERKINADALSRLHTVEVNARGFVVTYNVSFKDIDLIPMLSREEIISKKKEDDELCIIREKVEKGINTIFEIIEGILFSNMWGRMHVGKS